MASLHCLFARALWGDQRKYTTMWDAKYTGTVGSAAGPCEGSNNAHCGASFIPDAADQGPYLPSGHAPCRAAQGAEGVLGGPKTDIPWSIKWSRGLCNTLHAEGFFGGHVGPFFRREKFGFSFWDTGTHAVLRGKWTGALLEQLYCNPADATCDPTNTGPPPLSPPAETTAAAETGGDRAAGDEAAGQKCFIIYRYILNEFC